MISSGSRPGAGRRLFDSWLAIAARFAEVQTQVLVTAVYLFAVGPMGTAASLARRDLLAKRGLGGAESAWQPADTVTTPDLERAKRLF